MKIMTTVERIDPTTVLGEGVKVTYTYTSFDKDMIDRLYKDLSRMNGVLTEIEEVNDDDN